jgi:hypothetical protein
MLQTCDRLPSRRAAHLATPVEFLSMLAGDQVKSLFNKSLSASFPARLAAGQPVRSLWAMSGLQKYARHSRELGRCRM